MHGLIWSKTRRTTEKSSSNSKICNSSSSTWTIHQCNFRTRMSILYVSHLPRLLSWLVLLVLACVCLLSFVLPSFACVCLLSPRCLLALACVFAFVSLVFAFVFALFRLCLPLFSLFLLMFAFAFACFCFCFVIGVCVACFLFSFALPRSPSLSFPLFCSPLLSCEQRGGHSSAQHRKTGPPAPGSAS